MNSLKGNEQVVSGELCPCDSGLPFEACCQPIIDGANAPTALALMRSRYTAFVLCKADYLRHSWHPRTRPETIDFDPQQRWLGLKIKTIEAGEAEDFDGRVCFVARYKINGRGARMEECSRFVRWPADGSTNARWVYLEATVR